MNLRPFVYSVLALMALPALAEPIQTGLEAEAPAAVTDTATLTRELFQACEQGDTEKVRILLQQGAEVNVRNMKDFTPVGIAIKNGHTAIVQLLMQHGACTRLAAHSVDVEQVRAEIKSREIERTVDSLTHVEKNIIQRLLSPLMGDNDPIELFLGIPKRKDDGTFSWLLEGNDAYIKIGEFTPYDFKEMMISSVSIYDSGEGCDPPIFFKISKNGYILELHLYKDRYQNVLIDDSEDWVTFYAPSLHERIIKILENKYNLSQRL